MAGSLSNTHSIALNLLEYRGHLKISNRTGKEYIWCQVQKKHLVFSPEEFVRQLCIHWLIQDCGVSEGRISVEKKLNEQANRYDIAIYNQTGKYSCLIECKSFLVKLSPATIDQISSYNMTLNAPYTMITNGINAYVFAHEDTVRSLDEKELAATRF